MTKEEVVRAVYNGDLVVCTAEEYQNRVRRYLHEYAGKSIDDGDICRAWIALNEVKRLDRRFGVGLTFDKS